jgi:hypothetical protein
MNGRIVGLGLGKLHSTHEALQGETHHFRSETGLDFLVKTQSRFVCHESWIQTTALLVSWIGMNGRIVGLGLGKLHRHRRLSRAKSTILGQKQDLISR